MKNTYLTILVLAMLLLFGCKNDTSENHTTENSTEPAKVTLTNTKGKFQLLVDGEPFYINGAGLELGAIESIATHNGY